jgi:AraC-like DNA-binding protein
MLFSTIETALAGGKAFRRVAQVASPGLRVYVVQSRGLRFDARHIPVQAHGYCLVPRSTLQIVLSGGLLLRRAQETLLSRGDAALEWHQAWDEQWIGDVRILVLEWTTTDVSPAPSTLHQFRLHEQDLEITDALASRLEQGELRGDAARGPVNQLLRRLRVLGIPAEDLEPLVEPVAPPLAQPISDVLSSMDSSLAKAPSWVDVADRLGWSERQARRRLEDLSGWLGPGRSKLRERLHFERIRACSMLLTAPDATLDAVAASVGYGSKRAMMRAFEILGGPMPDGIRSAALRRKL